MSDNIKTPNALPTELPKQPDTEAANGPTKEPTDVNIAVDRLEQKLHESIQGAPISPRTKWLIGIVITALAGTAVPAATAVSTYATEKAQRETANATKKADSANQQRKMQVDLVKRIIPVAEKATLKDPTSIFQLGLIAAMVNENYATFGIKLTEAERTMKSMFDSLAPVAGLRRRLAESNLLQQSLQRQADQAKLQDKRTQELIVQLQQRIAQQPTNRKFWYRRLGHARSDAQFQLLKLDFFEQRLKQEVRFKDYFTVELQRQESGLKARLQQTASLRDRLKERTADFSYLVTKLKMQSKTTQEIAVKLRALLLDIEADAEAAQHDIKRLQAEISSERDALDAAKSALQRQQDALTWCLKQKNLVPVLPVPGETARKKRVVRRPVSSAMSAPVMSTPRPRRAPMSLPRRAYGRKHMLQGLF